MSFEDAVPGNRVVVRDLADARELFALLAAQQYEVAAFAYLDPEWRLLGMRQTPLGTRTAVHIPIRDVATDALAFAARHVVMAHNHPAGDPTPSADDRRVTGQLARALDALDITLLDHLVLAEGVEPASFRALGFL